MKLLKKLLPIATIASTAAIVAPVATSCSAILVPFVYDTQNMTEAWRPTTQQRQAAPITTSEATYEYLNDVKNNKQILADDLMFYGIQQFIESGGTPANIKKATMSIGNIQPESGRVSFSIDYEFEDDVAALNPGTIINMALYNFPIMVERVNNHWGFEPYAFYLFPEPGEGEEDPEDYKSERAIYMLGVKGWSLHIKYQSKAQGDYVQWDVSPSDIVLVIEHVLDYCKDLISFLPTTNSYLYYFDNMTQ